MNQTVFEPVRGSVRVSAVIVVLATLGGVGCKSSSMTKEQVLGVASEIEQAEETKDSARYVSQIANDAQITLVPKGGNATVVSKTELERFLEFVYPKTSGLRQTTRDVEVEIDADGATYRATVEEHGTFDGNPLNQVSTHEWRLAVVDGIPKITSMRVQVRAN